MTSTQVPIVAYHSIANDHAHLVSYLSLPLHSFERQLQYLQRKGFQTLTLYDVHRFLAEPRRLATAGDRADLRRWISGQLGLRIPAPEEVRNEGDDLRRHRFRRSLARMPADPRGCLGRAASRSSDLEWWGHLSWAELEAMQASGIIDVQAHTKTHAWYFASDRIVDFHHPDDSYFWLDWNARPQRQVQLADQGFSILRSVGTLRSTNLRPRSLRRRYFDDPEIARFASDVRRRAGRT